MFIFKAKLPFCHFYKRKYSFKSGFKTNNLDITVEHTNDENLNNNDDKKKKKIRIIELKMWYIVLFAVLGQLN